MIRHDRVLACRGHLDTEIGAGGRPCEDAGEAAGLVPQPCGTSPAHPSSGACSLQSSLCQFTLRDSISNKLTRAL